MSEKLIELKNVTFTYDGDDEEEKRQSALTDIDLTINKGEFVAVLGHNGSGKSTLAKLCNAVYEPTEGTVTVKGIVSGSEENDDKIRRVVGMVFQNPDNQLVATVVEEDVAFGPENLGIPPEEIRRRVDEAMALMGISEYARHSPAKLSGGQKQRVAIAGLLAMQPECMIFDEATAMLDPHGRQEVMSMILRLNKELGITILHITHNMSEAALADRVVVIDEGGILLDGTPRNVLSKADVLRKAGLDMMQCTELLYELQKSGVPIPYEETDPEKCAQILFACYKKS